MLTIFKGDDTGGRFGRTLNITITAADGVSLDGCRAEFVFDGIVRSFDDISSGDTVAVEYTHDETQEMALGIRFAALRIIDPRGKVRTFDNTIVVRVTSTVREAYPGSDSATIDVGEGLDWDAVTGKPDTFPPALSARQQAAVDSGITAELVAQIGRGSGVVSSVNGKTGAVVLDAADVGTYDAEEINEKINQFAAHYLTALPDGTPFPSVASLNSATQFYYAGEQHEPDKNDYCFVESDELHDGASARYMFVGDEGEGEWQYQYTVNETPLSFAQWAALNSGITAAKLAALATKTELAAKLDAEDRTVGFNGSDFYEDSTQSPGLVLEAGYVGGALVRLLYGDSFANIGTIETKTVQYSGSYYLHAIVAQGVLRCYISLGEDGDVYEGMEHSFLLERYEVDGKRTVAESIAAHKSGDSDKLGGVDASQYALKSTIVPPPVLAEDIDAMMNSYKGETSNNLPRDISVGDILLKSSVLYRAQAQGWEGDVWQDGNWQAISHESKPGLYRLVELFSSVNCRLADTISSFLPYAVNDDGTIKNRMVNKLTVVNGMNIRIPAKKEGEVRDFIVRIEVGSTAPTGYTWGFTPEVKAGDSWDDLGLLEANKKYIYRFTDCGGEGIMAAREEVA